MSLISFKSANATVQPTGTCAPRYVEQAVTKSKTMRAACCDHHR